jgi:serine protease Do
MKKCIFFIVLSFALSGMISAQNANNLKPLNRIKLPNGVKVGVLPALAIPPVTSDYLPSGQKLTPQLISEINKPATVMVWSMYNFTLTYPEPGSFMMILLKFEANNLVNKGQLANDGTSALNYILTKVASNPGAYITPTSNILTTTFNLGGTGSGAFISPDGFIVTNAHVVEIDLQTSRLQAAQSILGNIVDTELGKLIKDYGAEPDAKILAQCINSIFAYYGNFLRLTNESVNYTIKTGKTIENPSYVLPATLITKGGAIPNKDVAILKVQGSNFPTIAFGDDRKLKTGDNLYVMGYPGNIENSDVLKKYKMKEPSFTSGMMNARQETAQGWTAIQLDAATYKGNSGGPVFNEFGEVVGLLTFGSHNQEGTDLVQGFNFIVPSSVVGEFVRSANAAPKLGTAMLQFRKAILSKLEKPDESLTMLNTVREYNNDWPYLSQAINEITLAEANKPKPWYKSFLGINFKWYHYTGLIMGVVYLVFWLFQKIFD